MNLLPDTPQLLSFLRQAFIPLLAVILLVGHAYGQTPLREMPWNDSFSDSPDCRQALRGLTAAQWRHEFPLELRDLQQLKCR